MKAHPKGESGISYRTSPVVERKMKKLEKSFGKGIDKGWPMWYNRKVDARMAR
jgi:hypothetical protein